MRTTGQSADPLTAQPKASAATGHFRLVRYFTLTAVGLFVAVAIALGWFAYDQGRFFQKVQADHNAFFRQIQSDFVKQQDAAARRDLMTIHEAGNVNLTRLFANALWERDFAPFVARASTIPVDRCRAIADVPDAKTGKPVPPADKKACFADVGRQIAAFREFPALHAKVFDAMKKSTVFKIKVFDLRGITVYSSEVAQMGEDKSFNAGWIAGMAGKPASELTFRDKFSAFEGVVEKRDLISSYLPVHQPGTDRIVGVFEIYSDVTPFLDQIKATSAQIRKTSDETLATVQAAAEDNESKVRASSLAMLAIVVALLAVLFAALYSIVRRADRIIAQQTQAREKAQQQLAQSEQMASIGQMVAGVAHQLNTPLAFSHNNVSMAIEAMNAYTTPLQVAGKLTEIVRASDAPVVTLDVARARPQLESIDERDLDVTMPVEMLGDTLRGIDQMREMVQNLRDFTRLDRSKTAEFDINKGLRNVVYIARSVIPTHIEIVEDYGPLPAIVCNGSQLNQVFLNLVNNAAQAIDADQGRVTVRTALAGTKLRVDVTDTGTGIPPDVLPHIFDSYFTTKDEATGTGLGLAIARTIVREHGGDITVDTAVGKGTTFSVFLPVGATAAPATAQTEASAEAAIA